MTKILDHSISVRIITDRYIDQRLLNISVFLECLTK